MQIQAVTSTEAAAALRELPTLAIDLGFAEKRASCGLSNQSIGLTFAEAIDAAAYWINDKSQRPQRVLILEAPLSGSFDKHGNPCARGTFETHHSKTNRSSERRWQSGGGASMALAAIHFIRLLKEKTAASHTELHLVEGFCSRYGNVKPTDTAVANEVHRLWRDGASLIEPKGSRTLSVLHVLDSCASIAPPAILQVPDGFTSSTDH